MTGGYDNPIPQDEFGTPRSLLGIFAGVVEDTTDPLELGRCRVRVPGVEGDEHSTPTDLLPWAFPCFQSFSFVVPQVGDAVWITYMGGDPKYPVYLGWFPSVPNVEQFRQRHPRKDTLQYGPIPPTEVRPPDQEIINAQRAYIARSTGTDVNTIGTGNTPQLRQAVQDSAAKQNAKGMNDDTYVTPPDIEVVPEARLRRSPDPVIKILAKTPRGHTILASDDPSVEFLKIIDRLGQEIVFDCPVEHDENKNNKTPRDQGEAEKGTQIPIEKVYKRTSRIQITDQQGQVYQMWAEKPDGGNTKSRILLKSATNHWIEICSGHHGHDTESADIIGDKPTTGTEEQRITLWTKDGHRIRIDDRLNEIVIYHKSGSIIHLKSNGDIFVENSSGHHQILMNGANIISALEVTHKRLVWLENLMAKYNAHTHPYLAGITPSNTSPPVVPLTDADGTTVTLAG